MLIWKTQGLTLTPLFINFSNFGIASNFHKYISLVHLNAGNDFKVSYSFCLMLFCLLVMFTVHKNRHF